MRYVFFDKLHSIECSELDSDNEAVVAINGSGFIYKEERLYSDILTKDEQDKQAKEFDKLDEAHKKKVDAETDVENKAKIKAPHHKYKPIRYEYRVEIPEINIIKKIKEVIECS